MTTVVFDLPDDIAEQARREGLLSEETFCALLEAATRVAALSRLKEMWAATPADLQDAPPLPAETLQAIIRAARAGHPA
ncbi:MAG: hypothetical protein LBO79_09720 [Zoogloeaceae bacterium]|jgi:hypothetical protein|nr:hypothetical protein [Zoogloeaceae bacterium]